MGGAGSGKTAAFCLSLCFSVALGLLSPTLSATKMYARGKTGGQSEGLTEMVPRPWGLTGHCVEVSKAARAVGAGWREQTSRGCAAAA